MEIDISIPKEDLDLLTRIVLLEQIAMGATKEAGEDLREAVSALMTAAALVSLRNGDEPADMAGIIPAALEAAQKIIAEQLRDDG